MINLKGLVYIRHGRVGTRSEGPDYFLQTIEGDYSLQLNPRDPWSVDYQLEFYNRKIVEITGVEIKLGEIKVDAIKTSSDLLIG
jgi:hypothetical protein